MLVYIRARDWCALAAVGLFLAALAVWGFCGSVETLARGRGVILSDASLTKPDAAGAVREVLSTGSGRLESLLVAADDRVAAGQTVAVIGQPELAGRIVESEKKLELLRAYRTELLSGRGRDRAASADESPEDWKERLEADLRIVTEEAQLAALRERMDTASTVETLSGGRVLELLRSPGQLLREGDAILRVDASDGAGMHASGRESLRVHAFVRPGKGRSIREGMDAYILPSTVRRDESGLLVGRVAKVSRFPVSPEGIRSVLGNEELVREIMNGGAPLGITIELAKADSADSDPAYRWTVRNAPQTALRSGTICEVNLVLQRRRPIELVLPFLGAFFPADGPLPEAEDGGRRP